MLQRRRRGDQKRWFAGRRRVADGNQDGGTGRDPKRRDSGEGIRAHDIGEDEAQDSAIEQGAGADGGWAP
jgi:hypothetical protein